MGKIAAMSRRSKLVNSSAPFPRDWPAIPPFRGIPGNTRLRHITPRGPRGATMDAHPAAPGEDTLGRRLSSFPT